jgi:hypothetical protein
MSRVDNIIASGFRQTSRKYRRLARVPQGKTPFEALKEVDPHYAEMLLERLNNWAENEYLRVHANGEDVVELSDDEFKEYLAKTGRAPVL